MRVDVRYRNAYKQGDIRIQKFTVPKKEMNMQNPEQNTESHLNSEYVNAAGALYFIILSHITHL